MNEETDELGQAIDQIENLSCALTLPMPDGLHVSALRSSLPDAAMRLKRAFVAVTGEDPWGLAPIDREALELRPFPGIEPEQPWPRR
jgi:hypothetical protein